MKIKAAVIEAPGAPYKVEELELADPREDEILVKIVASGLCGTDEHAHQAHFPVPMPIVLGHEGAGIVEAVGSAVDDIKVGDHVVITYGTCGECKPCQEDRLYACEKWPMVNFGGRMADGYTPLSRDGEEIGDFFAQGSFASHCVAKAKSAAVIDPDFDLEIAGPLACGMQTGAGIVMNCLKMQEKPGQSFAVFGCGSVGMAAIMAAKIAGAETIIAVGGNPDSLELAKELGATHTINRKEVDSIVDAIHAICPFGVENALDTSGHPKMVMDMLHSTCFCGKDVVAGACDLENFSLPMDLGQKTLYGVSMGWTHPKEFIPQLIEYYKQGKFPYDKLITKFPFSKINDVFPASAAGEIIKGVVVMDFE